MTFRAYSLILLTLAACHHGSPTKPLGRVDGFGQIVKTLTWLENRNLREATSRDVSEILGAEAAYVQRRPVEIFGVWTDDLVWTDVTGRFEIVFARTRNAEAPFSIFRVSGRFPTKAAGVEAVAAWLALIDSANVARRIEELRASPESYVEYETPANNGAARISVGVNAADSEWSAGIDIENVGAGGRQR